MLSGVLHLPWSQGVCSQFGSTCLDLGVCMSVCVCVHSLRHANVLLWSRPLGLSGALHSHGCNGGVDSGERETDAECFWKV